MPIECVCADAVAALHLGKCLLVLKFTLLAPSLCGVWLYTQVCNTDVKLNDDHSSWQIPVLTNTCDLNYC